MNIANKARTHFLGMLLIGLMVAAAGCASTKTSESTGEFIDDSVITANVKSALLADKEAPGMSIQVETFKGRVQLSGFVNNEAQSKRAAELAARAKGVKSVINNITVKGDTH